MKKTEKNFVYIGMADATKDCPSHPTHPAFVYPMLK